MTATDTHTRPAAATSRREAAPAPVDAWYPVHLLRGNNPGARIEIELYGSRAALRRSDIDAEPRLVAADGGGHIGVMARDGLVWATTGNITTALEPYPLDLMQGQRAVAISIIDTDADFDQAVLGLVDPAHVPVVHSQWWWRSRKAERRQKHKAYTPSPYGFVARAMEDRPPSPLYKLIGATPEITIDFRLPGFRLERTVAGEHRLDNFTAVVPLGPGRQRLFNVIFTTLGWMKLVEPVSSAVGKFFLGQDGKILARTGQNAGFGQSMLFLGDPDLPSLWYFQLRRELAASLTENRAFRNPVRARNLTWKT